MDNLIFLNNELMNPQKQRDMHLPLTFISFAHIKGRMFRHFKNRSVFVIPNDEKKPWGNDVVYGAIFLCKDFDFYARIFDAYHACSMSTLFKNHERDIHHRLKVRATPIYFNNITELKRLMYRESDENIEVITYMGNTKHKKISQRLNKSVSYRIIDGIDKINFMKLFWEVTK